MKVTNTIYNKQEGTIEKTKLVICGQMSIVHVAHVIWMFNAFLFVSIFRIKNAKTEKENSRTTEILPEREEEREQERETRV
ncbi:MAG: hypothetical protein JAY75_12295 [Candidatus Thiodiazotropha taylori]|nr:hypothetical protein [Candidatus Thiodiazotropha taylori]MCG8077010.1 hypothetical protein [Candidatus Thiodiazotropha taylori]MCW4264474.1 hypothetical protein [Candidatus Thiodiazotropha endolucinida]MCW4308998.1 hypothetical protein [Candidatus Thiodiazotropha endolucinida]